MFTPHVDQPILSYIFFFSLVLARYLIIAGTAYFIIWIVLKKWTRSYKLILTELPKGQLSREFLYSVQTCLVFAIGGLINFYINKQGWGLYYADINEYSRLYWWFTLALMLVLNDLHFYWIHRLLHWTPLYKRFHVVHHLSRQTTPLTSQSFHFVESFLAITIVFIFPFLFPLHISAYVAFTFISFINNVYGHSGHELWPKFLLTRAPVKWLNTSSVHSWHHEKVHGNYGLYTIFWDKIFGTYLAPQYQLDSKSTKEWDVP